MHNKYENKQPFEFPKEFSELETKPNRTFNLYPNVILEQGDNALKSSNAKQTHNTSYPNVIEKQRDAVLKSSNPKETNNPYSPNVIEKQKDTVLKRSNAKQINSPTFDFPKQKTKLTSKHSSNPIPKIYLNENPTKNDPNNKKQISKISVDSFPDKLVEFEETVTSKGNDFLSVKQVLQCEFESQNLPPIELKHLLNGFV